MSERENNVYKAKLAEQAERYDGELKFPRKSSYFVCKSKSSKSATLKIFFFHQWLPLPETEKLNAGKARNASKLQNLSLQKRKKIVNID